MFKDKKIYYIGILLLLTGLFWLHSGDIIYHYNSSHIDHPDELEDINLGFSLLGLIPTLLGIYLIDKHNRALGRH
jgi:uncharacterized membrane protein